MKHGIRITLFSGNNVSIKQIFDDKNIRDQIYSLILLKLKNPNEVIQFLGCDIPSRSISYIKKYYIPEKNNKI